VVELQGGQNFTATTYHPQGMHTYSYDSSTGFGIQSSDGVGSGGAGLG
jgi:hypothetical protein